MALYLALLTGVKRNDIPSMPIKNAVAATSVGIVDGQIMLDLTYEEDSRADADFNVVMTDRGEFVEVQGAAERKPFSKGTLDKVLDLAEKGIGQLFLAQNEVIDS